LDGEYSRYRFAVSIRYNMKEKKKVLLVINDPDLHPKLKEIAKKQRWSVNTLINSVLEDLVIMQEPKKQTAA